VLREAVFDPAGLLLDAGRQDQTRA